jgi:hypothetical protein
MAAFLRHITASWRRYLVAIAIVAGAFLLARESCATHTLTKLETQGVAQDWTLATHKRNLKPTRQRTDSALTPANVKAERDSCDSTIAAANDRIHNLKHQVRLLKPASLALFGQVDYALNDRRALLLAGLQGRVTLPLVGQAQVYGAYSFPGWHVGLRKELRIR